MTWSKQVKLLLSLQDLKIEELSSSEEQNTAAVKKKDNKALILCLSHMSPSLIDRFVEFDTTFHSLWKLLQASFGIDSVEAKLNIQRRMKSLTLKEESQLQAHIVAIKALFREAAQYGIISTEIDKINIFIDSIKCVKGYYQFLKSIHK